MIEDALTYRTKETVLVDLAKALGFSAASLEANRGGKLTREQIQQFSVRVIGPVIFTVVWAVVPLVVWVSMLSGQKGLSFFAALSLFADRLTHFSDMVEANGKFGAILRVGSIVGGLVAAAFTASKIPLRLFFDLIDGTLSKLEGRVVAREEQTLRANGRDPIEKFFFNLRNDYFQVNLPAFRAIENGSVYIVYVTPRSRLLVSIEPKINSSESAADKTGSLPALAESVRSEPASSEPASSQATGSETVSSSTPV